jgi:hypothetical protein
MKNNFVFYRVVMEENKGSESSPSWKTYKAAGVVSDTPDKMGKIFSQNPELLRCSRIVSADYYPL